jgi:hypothetical protein
MKKIAIIPLRKIPIPGKTKEKCLIASFMVLTEAAFQLGRRLFFTDGLDILTYIENEYA